MESLTEEIVPFRLVRVDTMLAFRTSRNAHATIPLSEESGRFPPFHRNKLHRSGHSGNGQTEQKGKRERTRVLQFMRFQKTVEGIYFGIMEPLYNVYPLTIDHFRDRFADQRWLIYDGKRKYGYYYDGKEVNEITFTDPHQQHLLTGKLEDSLLDKDEKLFQQLWKSYFKAICIKERLNPVKHRKDMPVRYWKYLTEK